MLTNAPKSHKTNGSLGNLYINNWQENKRRIRMGNLYLIFYNFQRSNKDPTGLKK